MAKIKKLYMQKCGNIVTPDHFPSAPNTTREYKKLIVISLYVLEHPEHGVILIDTGVELSRIPEEELEIMACIRPGISKCLPEIGKTADDVKHVLISHFHWDHCAQNVFFPKATFHIRKNEWEAVNDPATPGYGKFDRDMAKEFAKEVRDLKLELIPDVPEYDIFGDGSVISLDTKGHTAGHQSFIVRFESGNEMLLTMDATHSEDELYDSRHIMNPWSLELAVRQTEMLKRYREETGRKLWICHDANQWYDCKKFPEYYE
ncbi:MAG: N-acyl homoserine lactonase family protein [Oscillospiraceae bacterium]|nr:N-acyl homoserine lactonase family protein [Oscillospiraceae bacterium]